AIKGMVGMLVAGVDRNAVDHCGGSRGIAFGHARLFPHVAILAGRTFQKRWRRTVLVPDHFEFDAWMDRDLMAGNAEFRFGDRLKVYAFTVDVDTRPWLISTRLDVIRVRVR